MAEPLVNLMLDSGAFSAWKRGEPIKLSEYIKFLHRVQPLAHSYINLDVIPGSPGAARTSEMVERAAERSWKNYATMVKEGLRPMVVFHYGERLYWLEKMVNEGCDYIGIGGIATSKENTRRRWLDEVFGYLCGDKGYPGVKVHGLGVTSTEMIRRYPWYTTDSVSWTMYGAYGWSVVPHCHPDGSYDFTRFPFEIHFSDGSKKKGLHKDAEGDPAQIRNMGAETKRYVQTYLDLEGFNIEDLRDDACTRLRMALRFFDYVIKDRNAHPRPFYAKRRGLFDNLVISPKASTEPPPEFKMFLGISVSRDYNQTLNDEGMYNRLLSYIYFRNKDPLDLKHFVRTGDIKTYGRLPWKVKP